MLLAPWLIFFLLLQNSFCGSIDLESNSKGRESVVVGDLSICLSDYDVFRTRANHNTAGFFEVRGINVCVSLVYPCRIAVEDRLTKAHTGSESQVARGFSVCLSSSHLGESKFTFSSSLLTARKFSTKQHGLHNTESKSNHFLASIKDQ